MELLLTIECRNWYECFSEFWLMAKCTLQLRHFSYYFLLLALFMRWRSPRCQNMPFSFLRLDGGLFKLSFSQFSRCLLSLNNNSSAIVDSMNQKWFHHERFYLSVTRLTASIFSVHHKHFSLPLQLETAFHNSRGCLWKTSLASELKKKHCSSFCF